MAGEPYALEIKGRVRANREAVPYGIAPGSALPCDEGERRVLTAVPVQALPPTFNYRKLTTSSQQKKELRQSAAYSKATPAVKPLKPGRQEGPGELTILVTDCRAASVRSPLADELRLDEF